MRGHVTRPKGRNRYYVVIDAPPGPDGKRRAGYGSGLRERDEVNSKKKGARR